MNVQQADPPWDEEPFRAGNPNLDPEPEGDPDLDAGGSVEPGRTPPDSNSATATPATVPDRGVPPAPAILIGLIAVIVLIGLFFVAYGVGLFS